MANNAKMYDVHSIIAAGIDPKTGLPLAMRGNCKSSLQPNIKKQLRIVDEQNAVNRYRWYNLPKGLDSQMIERILYYRGQGAFFKLQDQFYFLPYTLSAPKDGTGIDVYGRFTSITPLPFNGTSNDNDGKEKPWIRGLTYTPRYEMAVVDDVLGKSTEELTAMVEHSCVLLHDYTPQISQTNLPRQSINDPLLDVMADCIPFMRTALINGTGVSGMRVGSEAEAESVYVANQGIVNAALTGEPLLPIIGQVDFQMLGQTPLSKAEEYLLALQSLDNYRLSLYGLDNGGLFQKKSHMLAAEQEMNTANVGLVLEDGLTRRQQAALIANSFWGTEMWCMVDETTIGQDMSGDNVAGGDPNTDPAAKATPANNTKNGGEE